MSIATADKWKTISPCDVYAELFYPYCPAPSLVDSLVVKGPVESVDFGCVALQSPSGFGLDTGSRGHPRGSRLHGCVVHCLAGSLQVEDESKCYTSVIYTRRFKESQSEAILQTHPINSRQEDS